MIPMELHPRASLARALPALTLITVLATAAGAQESAMIRMLRSGRVAEDRQGALITLIGRQGSPEDLGALLELATEPDGLSESGRALALEALATAARTRSVAPEGDRSRIAALIRGESAPDDSDARLSAIRLAGSWEVEGAGDALSAIAADPDEPRTLREASLVALADVGGPAGREAIEALSSPEQPPEVRLPAIAALARIDVDAAAERAVAALAEGVGDLDAIAPLMTAFLDRQVGPDRLAAEIRREGLAEDAAKLALRYMYSVGRADPALVAALSEAAGMIAEPEPISEAELRQLIADVQAHGDPERGEQVFRRDDVNCMKCHAVSGAGGEIGPDLSPIGASSPTDYLIRSILYPEEAVKEEYQVRTVLTLDGQIVQGIVKESSDDRIVLREATGTDRAVPTADIEDEKSGGSLMPSGLVNFLTRDEFVDLVAFLDRLGKPGPYAIRSTPTVQRWRVLPLDADPDAVDPDDGGPDLPEAIASADPIDWRPAYGMTAGTLPLDEVSRAVGSSVFALRGEIDVTGAGELEFALDSPDGLTLWLDGMPVAPADRFTADLEPGRHPLTIRVDTEARPSDGLLVEVTRAEGSRAEFTVVGGP